MSDSSPTNGLDLCPFCGSPEALAFESDFPGQGAVWTVFCNACEAEGPHRPHREQAIDGWNARARSATEQAIRADERAKAFEDCAALLEQRAERCFAGCSQMGPMDWETGVSECALDARGSDCLCVERQDAIYSDAAAIRASSPAAKEGKPE